MRMSILSTGMQGFRRVLVRNTYFIVVHRHWVSPPFAIFFHYLFEPRVITASMHVPLAFND